jgi:hypothetical protein
MQNIGELMLISFRWEPYQSASGQKSLERQYGSYDPLYVKDLSVSALDIYSIVMY